MKAIFRKSTSFILALAMIIGILPTIAVPAAEAATAGTIVYELDQPNGDAWTAYKQNYYTNIAGVTIANGYNWEFNPHVSAQPYASTYKNFRIDGQSSTFPNPSFNGEGWGIAAKMPTNSASYKNYDLGFNIKVPTAGTYLLSANFHDYSDQANVGIYIGKNNIEEGDKVGTYVASSSGLNTNNRGIGTVTFDEAGTYILLMRAELRNGESSMKGYLRPISVSLTPVSQMDSSLVYEMKVNSDKTDDTYKLNTIYGLSADGSTQNIGWKVNMADGVNWNVNASLCSSNIISDTKLRIQNAGFIVGGTSNVTNIGFDIYVPATGEYKISSIKGWDYLHAAFNVKVNGSKVGVVPATAEQKASKEVNLNYTPDSGCETIVLKKGVNTIAFEGQGNGAFAVGAIALEAVRTWEDAENQLFNLRGYNNEDKEYAGTAMINMGSNSAKPEAGVTIENGWNWEFVPSMSRKGMTPNFQTYGIYNSMSKVLNTPIESDVVLKLNVTETNDYKLSMYGLTYAGGPVVAVYLDGVYVGQYDYSNTAGLKYGLFGYEQDLRTINVTEGVHYLTMRAIERGGNQYPGLIRMTAVDAAPAVTAVNGLVASATELEVGDTATVSATNVSYGSMTIPYVANITDGAGNDARGNNDMLALTSSAPGVVAVENGMLKAVSAGTAIISCAGTDDTITVKVNEAPVEIVNAEIFGDVSAYITNSGEFVAFSGIDTTEYKEVGFYIALDNGDFVKCAVADGKVYKTINVTSSAGTEEIDVNDFFKSTPAGENAYVFFSGTTLGSATTVKFYPYAVPVEGAEKVGYTYTVSLSK